jgi:hypothetical protein
MADGVPWVETYLNLCLTPRGLYCSPKLRTQYVYRLGAKKRMLIVSIDFLLIFSEKLWIAPVSAHLDKKSLVYSILFNHESRQFWRIHFPQFYTFVLLNPSSTPLLSFSFSISFSFTQKKENLIYHE